MSVEILVYHEKSGWLSRPGIKGKYKVHIKEADGPLKTSSGGTTSFHNLYDAGLYIASLYLQDPTVRVTNEFQTARTSAKDKPHFIIRKDSSMNSFRPLTGLEFDELEHQTQCLINKLSKK